MKLVDTFLTRTLRIRGPSGAGSAVWITVGARGYFVTAAHVVSGLAVGDRLPFRVDDGWASLQIAGLQHREPNDLAVLVSDEIGPQGIEERLISGQLTVGQAIAYCGFPLGLEGLAPEGHRWPIPLVKSGIYSGSMIENGHMVHYFDTVNNKGFSGGPIYAEIDGAVKLAGIVSGYKFDRPIAVEQRATDGTFKENPDVIVQPNSGFMRGVPIRRALELIAEGI